VADRGLAPADLPDWLAETVAAHASRARRSEERSPAHYATHRRPSTEIDALRCGLGATVFGDCELVRPDLGVRDDEHLLLQVIPRINGACGSASCTARTRCPAHPLGQGRVSAETFMNLAQGCVAPLRVGERVWLGRNATWWGFAEWHAWELGELEHEEHLASHLAGDALLRLLLRLTKRGSAIGWSDDGGTQGWLSAEETRSLVAELEPYDISAEAPVPTKLWEMDAFVATDALPAMRAVLLQLLSVAKRALDGGHGILLDRD
jgi:hypothetical protein